MRQMVIGRDKDLQKIIEENEEGEMTARRQQEIKKCWGKYEKTHNVKANGYPKLCDSAMQTEKTDPSRGE